MDIQKILGSIGGLKQAPAVMVGDNAVVVAMYDQDRTVYPADIVKGVIIKARHEPGRYQRMGFGGDIG